MYLAWFFQIHFLSDKTFKIIQIPSRYYIRQVKGFHLNSIKIPQLQAGYFYAFSSQIMAKFTITSTAFFMSCTETHSNFE